MKKAKLRLATQLLVRLGKRTYDKTAKKNEHMGLTNLPAFFDPAKIPPLSIHHIVFFDECHKKTKIGRQGDTTYLFPRDEKVIFDIDGEVAKVDTKLHVKYAKEGCFSFGVVAVLLSDGTVEGQQCKTFDYSAKNLIMISAEEKMIKEEIQRVKTLKTGGQ
jgi:hypothetical protein